MTLKKTPARNIFYVFISFVLLMISHTALADTAKQIFEKAQESFQRGQYQTALQGFVAAKKQGITGPAIEYNLGVTEYKLEHYTQAKLYFSKLTQSASMRPLAAYNLGLVEDKLGNKSLAIKWMKISYRESKDDKLQALASIALGKLGVVVNKPYKSHLNGSLGLLYGNDSNVVDPTNKTANITDSFTTLYAGLYYRPFRGLSTSGFFLNQDYQTANNYDYQYYDLRINQSLDFGDWNNQVGLISSNSVLGGTAYEDATGMELRGQLTVKSSNYLRLRLRFDQITAPTARQYLQGTQEKFRIEWVDKNNIGNRYIYEFETNDRANSPSSSYSPTRHTLRYARQYNLTSNWRLEGYVDYRDSQYTQVGTVQRQDQRMRFKIGVRRKFNKHIQAVLDYAYSNNQSNVASYSYSRNVARLGMKAYF